MKPLTADDMKRIGDEIDRLFMAKGRPRPDPEMKAVWILDFDGLDMRAIIYGFQHVRRTPGVWPEVSRIIEGAREWSGKNSDLLLTESSAASFQRERLILFDEGKKKIEGGAE